MPRPFLRVMATLIWATLVLPAAAQARVLTFEERVNAQRAIEEVYWRHRIWPQENPTPKPAFSETLTEEDLAAKVEDALAKSAALEALWQRPVTAVQLQAELDRMARDTRDPALLRELFAALGQDPYVIAETLARATLVDRLMRSWFASDERIHGNLRLSAQAAIDEAAGQAQQLHDSHAQRADIRWVRGDASETDGLTSDATRQTIVVDDAEWSRLLDRLGRDETWSGAAAALIEEDHAFVWTSVESRNDCELTGVVFSWPKRSFDDWWASRPRDAAVLASEPGSSYRLPSIAVNPCSTEGWSRTLFTPDPRFSHRAVWTGSEMILWGGYARSGLAIDSGGRYDPSTDTWRPTSIIGAPEGRADYTAVWTGRYVVVWGGRDYTERNTGGRYDPAIDTWTATATLNAPTKRVGHSAVWTGTQMIVWGGIAGTTVLGDGAGYDPFTDTWTALSAVGAPAARSSHSAVWSGNTMLVWGGASAGNYLDTGGRYDPTTNSWTATTLANAPVARSSHTAIWSGQRMIVWGGSNNTNLNSGARYDPVTDTWTTTSTFDAPVARTLHTAIWTGTTMMVWGGTDGAWRRDGGSYDPEGDTWEPIATGPTTGQGHSAVWSGKEMIVWGGYDGGSRNSGGRFDPVSKIWAATRVAFTERLAHTAVWTGTEMIVWGGEAPAGTYSALDTGASYEPAIDEWREIASLHAPHARLRHTALWTGNEMLIWGGQYALPNFSQLNSGGRYRPAKDRWTPTSLDDAPLARASHAAVWTGTEMIVWSGDCYSYSDENSGGRYDPTTDTWKPTATIGAPAGRAGPTGVWTGTEMIVWGGETTYGAYLSTGGSYAPLTNSWRSLGSNAPLAGRVGHSAVWTGSEMIVWGGGNVYSTVYNSGARYNPASGTWIPIASVGPSARKYHTASWTGSEMIIWGGTSNGSTGLASGNRYDPVHNLWAIMSQADVPEGRAGHSAIWTGSEMIVYGGYNRHELGSGGRYRLGNEGAYCDDGNPCTMAEACAVGVCAGGTSAAPPSEVRGVTATSATRFEWPELPAASVTYDVTRGTLGGWPALGDPTQTCIMVDEPGARVTDPSIPVSGYWYLVRGRDACAVGTWGIRADGMERVSACP